MYIEEELDKHIQEVVNIPIPSQINNKPEPQNKLTRKIYTIYSFNVAYVDEDEYSYENLIKNPELIKIIDLNDTMQLDTYSFDEIQHLKLLFKVFTKPKAKGFTTSSLLASSYEPFRGEGFTQEQIEYLKFLNKIGGGSLES